MIVDGADNFPTRYLLNDASVRLRKPVVSASILSFDGQISTFVPFEGPCYRCLYPTPPPAELAPSCSANGVLGVMAGTMGTLQANEVIKLVLGVGEPLVGRLCSTRRSAPASPSSRSAATPSARSAARTRPRSPSRRWASSPTTSSSAPGYGDRGLDRRLPARWRPFASHRCCAPRPAASPRSRPTARPSARSCAP